MALDDGAQLSGLQRIVENDAAGAETGADSAATPEADTGTDTDTAE
jgi:DNA gyrase subunit A